ncbi:MAG: hypothetical protein RRY55_06555 [Bacteroidales bacterium]
MADWFTIISAIGGFEAVKWGITYFATRGSFKKREAAEAQKEEAAADAADQDNRQRQVDWLEKRISERDAKIDSLYIELRAEQGKLLTEIYKRHEQELQLKELEVKRCEIRKCSNRKPPGDF